MALIFIDGSSGTTGLKIYDRLKGRSDIDLLILPEGERKDPVKIKEALHAADISFLCLPDEAAKEAVALAEGSNTVIIDTSTAHRTDPEFVYGFPEITGVEKIKASKKIANPGCHASGFIALIYPLVKEGLISKDAKLSCFSLTGYSGGGKKMIAQYEAEDKDKLLEGPRQYALTQEHKHLKEMKHITGLSEFPVFSPIVADFYSGMEVMVPLFASDVKGSMNDIKEAYKGFYTGPLVHFDEEADEEGFLSAAVFAGRDDMQITVTGNAERMMLTARFDNLGKGASGAAIQNMNIILGTEETLGLVTGGELK